jgi:hypothetical protein
MVQPEPSVQSAAAASVAPVASDARPLPPPPSGAETLRAQLSTLLDRLSPSTSDDEDEIEHDDVVPRTTNARHRGYDTYPGERSISQQLSDQISQQISDQISQQISDQISDEISAQLDAQLDAQFEAAMQEYYEEELHSTMDAELDRQIDQQLQDMLSQQHIGSSSPGDETSFWDRQLELLSRREAAYDEQEDDPYYDDDDYEFDEIGNYRPDDADGDDTVDYTVPAAAEPALSSIEELGVFFDAAQRRRAPLARVLDVDTDALHDEADSSSSVQQRRATAAAAAAVGIHVSSSSSSTMNSVGMTEAELHALLDSVYGAAGRPGDAPKNVTFGSSSGSAT